MKALVGRVGPRGRRFQARPIELEGQPSWTLAQMRVMWGDRFGRDTDRMVTELLRRDWSVLAATAWPASVTEPHPQWCYIDGVGRGLRQSGQPVIGEIPAHAPINDGWAYLWEQGLGALHVYAARYARWHHLATVPIDVWTDLTAHLVADVESRWCWLDRGEEPA